MMNNLKGVEELYTYERRIEMNGEEGGRGNEDDSEERETIRKRDEKQAKKELERADNTIVPVPVPSVNGRNCNNNCSIASRS